MPVSTVSVIKHQHDPAGALRKTANGSEQVDVGPTSRRIDPCPSSFGDTTRATLLKPAEYSDVLSMLGSAPSATAVVQAHKALERAYTRMQSVAASAFAKPEADGKPSVPEEKSDCPSEDDEEDEEQECSTHESFLERCDPELSAALVRAVCALQMDSSGGGGGRQSVELCKELLKQRSR